MLAEWTCIGVKGEKGVQLIYRVKGEQGSQLLLGKEDGIQADEGNWLQGNSYQNREGEEINKLSNVRVN
uniref:Uncharacterized protein n=1 Tax=Arundo donax TaxID=35708 RepID=A0A0A9DSP1_ARUDO